MTGRRIVSIWLPQFPMERWRRQAERRGDPPPDDVAQALLAEGPHGPVIHAANRPARLAGVTPGARLADVRALCPALRVDHADPGGDAAALGRLALWARRWCPWTAADGQGLVLDATGAAHLWGGEAAMLAEIEGRLAVAGFTAHAAVAPGWGAAWALARFGPVRAICHDPATLAPLPAAALRLGEDTLLLLTRLGLKTVGDLLALPRLALARRFARAAPADNPLLRLDQLTGRLAEPVSPPGEPPVLQTEIRLAEPIQDPTAHLPGLCADLCARLAAAGQGARRLRLTVFRTDGETARVEAATALPSRDPGHLAFLFRDRLERIDPGYGFDLILFQAVTAEPLGTPQARLDGGTDQALDLSQLVDRLAARFGTGALTRPALRESHVPERAEAPAALLAEAPAARPLDRPLRLFDPAEEIAVFYAVPEGPPAQFLWRRRTHRVTRYQGPERIAPEWWHDRPGTRLRDYFRVEDEGGHRYWLYREGLAGDGRGGAPRWFLHGVFA